MDNLTKIINKKAKSSKTTSELISLLKTISEDEEFILGTICCAENEEDKKTLIDYIKNGDDVSYSNILCLAVYLDNVREGIE